MPDTTATPDSRQAWSVALVMALGYVGVYLCRHNLSVALPLLQDAYRLPNTALGVIASTGTAAYTAGKFLGGPVIDRVGGRGGYLLALGGVALFCALGAFAPGLTLLTALYAANRFFGSGAWTAMMKVVSSWFTPRRIPAVIAIVSLSYIFGGAAAKLFAEQILVHGGDWRAVMGLPTLVLLVFIAVAALAVRRGPVVEVPRDEPQLDHPRTQRPVMQDLRILLAQPSFQAMCALALTLTLLRDALGNWGVHYLLSTQAGQKSVAVAAVQSTGFDFAGAIPVLALGFTYGRFSPRGRRRLIVTLMLLLAIVLLLLGALGKGHPQTGAILFALAGFLIYGPFSILGPTVAMETGGTELAGTAIGLIDGVGYAAAILGDYTLGFVLDRGGYPLAFTLMAGLTLLSAMTALRLRGELPAPEPVASAAA